VCQHGNFTNTEYKELGMIQNQSLEQSDVKELTHDVLDELQCRENVIAKTL
jgi:hypothetical protein